MDRNGKDETRHNNGIEDEQDVDYDTLDTVPGQQIATRQSHGLPRELLDEYRVVDLIGQGSMGRVFRAVDKLLLRVVALKVISCSEDSEYEHLHERFLVEARAAARCQHPNIASIYSTGTVHKWLYLVEEYVAGSNLSEMLKPVTWQRALALGRRLASALMAAHQKGVLHRDIKPANIIIGKDGTPKLVDFGLAKLIGDVETSMVFGVWGSYDSAQVNGGSGVSSDSSGVVGTPYYIAPEIWRGERATMRSDVYGLGVVLYELCTGRVPFHDVPVSSLGRIVAAKNALPLSDEATNVDLGFAKIVDRCICRVPGERFAHGGELWDALEALHHAGQALSAPSRAPYRGLFPFEAEHSGIFFGREADIRRVVERLRGDRMVVVVGESGVGKSSLLRAGVLPRIVMNGLGDGRCWDTVLIVPGQRPLVALADALGRILGTFEPPLIAQLKQDAAAVSRMVRRRQKSSAGAVICIDQLEELVTLSDRDEATMVSESLACLLERTPGLRVVAAVRGDKVTSVVKLPGLGMPVERALVFLRPLGYEAVRKTIVEPARINGVRFESENTVETLIQATVDAPGGLPLLQFAMTQLWERRNTARAMIHDQALADIGGVAGALSQHADKVVDGLAPETRATAHRILMQLVGVDGTRRPRSASDLGGSADERRAALDVLIGGRLVVVREVDGTSVYELAHESLATGWKRLSDWLDEEGGERVIKERLTDAAAEWERKGRPGDMLWPASRLDDARGIVATELSEPDRSFLETSRRRLRQKRRNRFVLGLLFFFVGIGAYPGLQYWQARQSERAVEREVKQQLEDAIPHLEEARRLRSRYFETRNKAHGAFLEGRRTQGETLWNEVLQLGHRMDAEYHDARLPIELAFLHDSEREDVRALLAEVMHAQALLAESHGDREERERLLSKLELYDASRTLYSQWKRKIKIVFSLSMPDLKVRVYRYDNETNGSLTESLILERSTPSVWELEPGSYVLAIELSSKDRAVEVRYPVWLPPVAAGHSILSVDFPLEIPEPDAILDGFVYVGAGSFQYGFGATQNVEPVRQWYQTMPLHERQTGPFLIARYETTFAQWLTYATEQTGSVTQYLPNVTDVTTGSSIRLRALQDGGFAWFFRATETATPYEATSRESNVFYDRGDKTFQQNWLRFPVTGVSPEHAEAYTAWLRTTGRVPGARLCREDEWERAVRGADGRLYPHGNRLDPDDANYDLTYGKKKSAYGLDEVDAHPRSRSPFGLEGAVGNAREIVVSADGEQEEEYVLRGGSYFFSGATGATANREAFASDQALPYAGFRVCANWPPPDGE